MIGAEMFDWATQCGECKARRNKTAIRRLRWRDRKAFMWLDTQKTQGMFSKENACKLCIPDSAVVNTATGVRFSTKPLASSNGPQSFPVDSLRMLVSISCCVGYVAHFSQIFFEGLAPLACQTANR